MPTEFYPTYSWPG